MSKSWSVPALFLASALSFAPIVAAQTYAPPASDAQAVELHKLGKERRSSVNVPGGKLKAGRAEIFVHAPVSTVRAAVLDYANYPTVIPRFQKAKVLKKTPQSTDVYLQIPILKGAANIWTVQRFGLPVTTGSTETVNGVSVQGNVEDLRTKWSYRAVDAQHTVLIAEIYVVPKLPVPGDVITNEAQRAAAEAVVSVRAHAEKVAKTLAKNP